MVTFCDKAKGFLLKVKDSVKKFLGNNEPRKTCACTCSCNSVSEGCTVKETTVIEPTENSKKKESSSEESDSESNL